MDVGDGQEHLRTSTGIAAPTYMDELLYFAAHLEHLTVCKEENEQTTTHISLGMVCCRVYPSTI